jgi:hypothetical protein
MSEDRVIVWVAYDRDKYATTTRLPGCDVELISGYGKQSFEWSALVDHVTTSARRLVKMIVSNPDMHGAGWANNPAAVICSAVACPCPFPGLVFAVVVLVNY